MSTPELPELKPCPFCGAGHTSIVENGRVWAGTKWGEPASVSVRHHCEPVDGHPSRMVERVGRDKDSAIAAWNRRAARKPMTEEQIDRCALESSKGIASILEWLRAFARAVERFHGID